jgi:hypothetical protein
MPSDLLGDVIDGGTGHDTLNFLQGGSFDVGDFKANEKSIDEIDFSNVSAGLVLDAQDVLDISDQGSLTVTGGNDDIVSSIGQGWQFKGSELDNGHAYNVYEAHVGNQTAHLLLDVNMNQGVS